MADERLRIILELEASGVKLAAGNSSAALKALEAQAARTRAELGRLKTSSEQLRQVSQTVAIAGSAIAGPFLAAAKAYVDATGRGEVASRRWLNATDRIRESFIDVGRVSTSALLPALEKAAGLAERAAKFAEANPNAVKAALGIGGGLIALGALGSIAAKGIQIYADVKLLGAAALQEQAANKMLAAAQLQAGAATGGAAVTGGGGIGRAVNVGLTTVAAATIFAPIIDSIWKTGAKMAFAEYEKRAGINPGEGGLYGYIRAVNTQYGPTGISQFRALIDQLSGGLQTGVSPAGQSMQGRSATLVDWDAINKRGTGPMGTYQSYAAARAASRTNALPMFQDYQAEQGAANEQYGANVTALAHDYHAQLLANEADYHKQSERATRDFNAGEARIEADFNSTRVRQLRDFQQSEQRAQADFTNSRTRQLRDFAESEQADERAYYDDRMKRARDYGIETARDEEDHQRDMLRLQEDHTDRAGDLARSGDALGFVKEQRAYERSRKEAEDNYQEQQKRRNADYALELADAEKAFAEQRKERLDAFEQSQADQAEDFERGRKERLAAFEQAQADAKADFDDQRRQRADEQRQRLTDMKSEFDDQQAKLAQQANTRLLQLNADFKKENTAREAAFVKQVNALDAHLTGQYKMQVKAQEVSSIEFGKWLDALKGQVTGDGNPYCPPGYHYDAKSKSCKPDKTGKAAGGYAGLGMHLLGEQGREFVLSNPTMNAAERLTGGPLTQERILASLARSNSYNVNLGGIAVNGAGGHGAALAQTLALVDERITDAFNQFHDAIGTP